MNRILVIGLLVLTAMTANAQRLVPEVHDLGRIKLYNNPTLVYTFTNTSKEKVLFLPTAYQQDLYIELPQGYIHPGESVKIVVKYYTETGGRFSIHQPIYINTQDDPLYINIKGKIISFHPNALAVCPSMSKTESDVKMEQSATPTLTTYDKYTGQTVKGVDIVFSGSSSRLLIEETSNPMVTLENIPIGLYQVEVSKKGYKTAEKVLYINRGGGHFIIELEPTEEIVKEETIVKENTTDSDTVIVLDPTEPDEEEAIDRIRQMIREKYKDRTIIERDVVVVKEREDTTNLFEEDVTPGTDTSRSEIVSATPPDTMPDFDESGRLSQKYALNNVVFLIDVSSSMRNEEKLPLLKESMKSMVEVLRPEDRVTIITYASSTKVLLQSVPGDHKEELYAVIDSLYALGYSKGADGMEMAYNVALRNFIDNGNNQVILATDGLFNSNDLTKDDLYQMADVRARENRVRISVVGFGKNKDAISFLEQLSQSGMGNFIKINSDTEARTALVQEIMENALISP